MGKVNYIINSIFYREMEVRVIAKTDLTVELERGIWTATNKQGVFGCFEVTIGWFGKERVDYITYDTQGIWRCYEIKVSKSDFYSKAAKTFIGHYNYFVMPSELYEAVKQDIPAHVGVHDGVKLIKRPKRQELQADEQVLKDSMIRSMSREFSKQYSSGVPSVLEYKDRQIRRLESERNRYSKNLRELEKKLYNKFGRKWYDELEDME